MNNRQNGRRRGRGGQQARNGQPGGQDRGNRIDNRARGNAAQLLEKYKSLARDAQMQGDRVNTEYYLQFADHYFRVLSESRSRFEEQRPRPQHDYRDDFGDGDMDGDTDGQPYAGEQPQDGGWNDAAAEQPVVAARVEQERSDPSDQPERLDEPRRDGRRPRRNGRSNGQAASNGAEGGPAAADAAEPVSERIEVDRLPQGLGAIRAEGEDGGAAAEAEPAPRRRRAPRRPRDEVAVDA